MTPYRGLVRLLLEYSSILWDLITASGSVIIERVQRRFLSYASHVLNIFQPLRDYSSVLHVFGLSTLADKRVDINWKFFRNLISSSVDAPSLLSLINFRILPRPTRITTTFAIPLHTTDYCSNNHIHRMMRLANVHPSFLH
ncbi:Hypothetical protein CINCED_3A025182 [Cinara cedri]|uniref:Uncharacterized protein n=1 Tax=Cinara cedri TaxID=506608 RepID=A0A5E4MLC1_9HEMI|nr:Hypothetical protein CINCED_3A025182 [Cinara cedri]